MLRIIDKSATRRKRSDEISQKEKADYKRQNERADFFRRNPHVPRGKIR